MRFVLVALLGLAVSCGPRIDDKKSPPSNNDRNNTSNNTTSTNNTTNNTTGSNNTTGTNNTNNTIAPQRCATVSPQSLNLGVVEVGQSEQATVTLENCSNTETLTLDEIAIPQPFAASLPANTTLQPLQSLTIPIVFSPQSAGVFNEVARFITDADELSLGLAGETPVDESCPTTIATVSTDPGAGGTSSLTVPVGTTVRFDGSQSTTPDGLELFYQWSFIDKPGGSTAQLMPNNDVAMPTLFLDRPGRYELLLEAFTTGTDDACPDARVTVVAEPGAGGEVRIELTWDTPGDADQTDMTGADLDLHYLHPNGTWDMSPWDCFWRNRSADWGADGRANVERDDTDGQGPERVVHTSPGPRTYNVGVYYYSDNALGPSYATVSVFLDGQLTYELSDQFLAEVGVFMYNIEVDWPNRTVVDTNRSVTNGFP